MKVRLKDGGYPDHSCNKPWNKPYKPLTFYSQAEIDTYNFQVRNYNWDVERYIDCINDYTDAANNDIELIVDSINDAINEANNL